MSTSIVRSDGSVFTFDSTLRLGFGPSIIITEHPIEDGSVVSDHAQKMALPISISGVISGSPPDAGSWEATNPNRQIAARDFFASIVGELVSLVTVKFGTITSLMLTRYPYSVDNVNRTVFDIELKETKIASAGSVFIDYVAPAPSTATGMSTEQDVGEQSKKEPTEAESEVDSTVLYKWLYGDS